MLLFSFSTTFCCVFAQETFDIAPQKISVDSYEIVKLKTSSFDGNYSIRPISDDSNIEIFFYDNSSNLWISSNDLWTEMPKLVNEELELKIVGAAPKAQLYFQIQNKQNAQIHTTNKIQVYLSKNKKDYISNLNQNINAYTKIPYFQPNKQSQTITPAAELPNNIEIAKTAFFVVIGGIIFIKYVGNPFAKESEIDI